MTSGERKGQEIEGKVDGVDPWEFFQWPQWRMIENFSTYWMYLKFLDKFRIEFPTPKPGTIFVPTDVVQPKKF